MTSSSSSTAEMKGAEVVQPAHPEPYSGTFWGQDAYTTNIRKAYLTILAKGTLLTAVVVLLVLSIYVGSLWKVENGIHNLNGWIVDFDGGAMGQVVQAAAMGATGPKNKLSWSSIPSSRFPNGPTDLAQAILDEEAWVAIVISPGATARLDSAVSTANASYDSSSAVTIYAVEARNENSYSLFLVPQSEAVMDTAVGVFADQHAKQLSSNPNATMLLSNAPGVVTRPLYYTLRNLRPYDTVAANVANFIGLIYLLIISVLVANMTFMARIGSGLGRHLLFRPLIMVRYFSAVSMYFILTLVFALLLLAFQIPFDRRFGNSGFVIFWMMCWLATCALGLAVEVVVTVATPRFSPFFMVLWIITNVSVCYHPIEILPTVYRYGFAIPFYNVSKATRTIVFSTRNQIGLNFGVQFGWIALSLMTMPLVTWLTRRKEVREWRAKSRS